MELLMVRGELENAWLQRYERWASIYDEEHQIAGWSRQGLLRRLALVLQIIHTTNLGKGSFILDLGAGPGTYTRAISGIGHRCLGFDYSRKALEAARKKGSEEPYIQGEAYELPFRSNTFAAVVCVGVLQSLETPKKALKEMQRVLRPGGHLLVDGLNDLFWVHRLRSRREKRVEKKRMSYYDPFAIQAEAQSLGFESSRLHWLAIPESLQTLLNGSSRRNGFWLPRLFGHAFLLHAQKGQKSIDGERSC